MFKLIKNGHFVTDEWKTLTLAEGDTPQNVRLPVGPVLVPLSVWRARRAELIHREYEHGWPLGVWLAAEESPEAIGRDIDDFTVIAVEFDKFSDGRSYSTARLLRERYGYKGELRAIGDVPRDKPAWQQQVGFDAFVVRANQKAGAVLSGLFGYNAANQSDAVFPLGAVAG
ncbi:MAG: hypothetical protein A3F73_12270 [Gallionellales bacterium RIFCSPLOWO2_12_FULL_59_22]|nr:MAG: hypothetical protein A3H99_01570 [Gallionellales bacterium RIFCSPLOWO2_02_FULL_59_110]OGT02118.1 MAG: hypothetical protein A2Z65_10115 [Gallionellales bacterium RIFCSPLOWO2_02_58_13]OGT12238.1 MAG: hypothetical protein A3F73_12270 [Gallionellales bacterium RIFCSPLOWO2_12_FULL_59_22]